MTRHATFLGAILLGFVSVLSYAQAPVPFINQPLVPDATPPGGAQFTLTVNGTGFVSSSVVNWNGNALATQFVSGSQLTVTVPAADITTASTASVTVVNPAPGGGTSNVVFFTVAANAGKFVAFTPPSSLSAGLGAESLVVGDFNGDGKLDVAVANYWSNNLSILLGDGKGNFTLVSSPGVGTYPWFVAAGDFNGDGKLDLATSNVNADNVSILLGDGTGNFTLVSSPGVGSYPSFLVVGDFNGDGKLDLVASNQQSNDLSILLGDGTGNFTLASSLPYGSGSAASGDFNGDGKLDLAVPNGGSNTVSILLGDGTGNFTLTSSWGVGTSPEQVAVGDFNGDGKLDLAVLNYGASRFDNSTVSILLGDGKGNFTQAPSLVVGNESSGVAVGDFNGDGKLDLVVTLGEVWGTVAILLGDGTGSFTLASTPDAGFDPVSVAVGDFNGDGKLDLAVVNIDSNSFSILLGVPPGPYVTYNPSSLSFGSQLVGTSSTPQAVTMTNIGSEIINITRVVTTANFSETNNCPRQLPPGGTCMGYVVFTPHKVNTITGTVTITDNAPGSPQMIPLSGAGIAVILLPSSLDFGNQQVGTTSPPQTVTLTNYAPKPVTISGGDFTGNNPGSFKLQNTTCGHTLPAGGSCTINIAFAPTGQGTRTATLEVNDNGGLSPQTVWLSGNGTR